VVEVNFGGDMATEVVKQAAERVHQRGGRDTNMIRVKEVSASQRGTMAVGGSIPPPERGRSPALQGSAQPCSSRTIPPPSQAVRLRSFEPARLPRRKDRQAENRARWQRSDACAADRRRSSFP
jgi:hypothetical protein